MTLSSMFRSSVLLLLLTAAHAGFPNPNITTARLQLTSYFSIDPATCVYTLTFTFRHDPTLPQPAGPEDCATDPVALDETGVPYLETREFYHLLDESIRTSTPFDHLSVDYSPCGHPPVNVFTKPHYDFHIYVDTTVADRQGRTCALLDGAPVCDFLQPQVTAAGRAFFDPIPGDVPTHVAAADSAQPYKGIHSWDPEQSPETADGWVEPIFITGGYGEHLTFWEPMFPLDMVTGDQDLFYEETIPFAADAPADIPRYYSMSYRADTGVTTLTISQGRARNCTTAADTDATMPMPMPTPTAAPTTTSQDTSHGRNQLQHHPWFVVAVAAVVVGFLWHW